MTDADPKYAAWLRLQSSHAELIGARRLAEAPQHKRPMVLAELERAYDEAVERYRAQLDGEDEMELCAWGDVAGCGGATLFEPRALDHEGVCERCRAVERESEMRVEGGG